MDDDTRVMLFQPVLGMPTSVLKYGDIHTDTKAMFLVIPGKFIKFIMLMNTVPL